MFDNLTPINISLVSVREKRRRSATRAQGVCCRVQKKKLRLNSRRSGETLALLVCASLESWLLVQMEAIVHTKTLRSNVHPHRYPLWI